MKEIFFYKIISSGFRNFMGNGVARCCLAPEARIQKGRTQQEL
jgi:hypothetical protein